MWKAENEFAPTFLPFGGNVDVACQLRAAYRIVSTRPPGFTPNLYDLTITYDRLYQLYSSFAPPLALVQRPGEGCVYLHCVLLFIHYRSLREPHSRRGCDHPHIQWCYAKPFYGSRTAVLWKAGHRWWYARPPQYGGKRVLSKERPSLFKTYVLRGTYVLKRDVRLEEGRTSWRGTDEFFLRLADSGCFAKVNVNSQPLLCWTWPYLGLVGSLTCAFTQGTAPPKGVARSRKDGARGEARSPWWWSPPPWRAEGDGGDHHRWQSSATTCFPKHEETAPVLWRGDLEER